VTTARDLVPPRKGETRRRASHRRLASNNIRTIERLKTRSQEWTSPCEWKRTNHRKPSGKRLSPPPTQETSARGSQPTSPLIGASLGTSSGCGTQATENVRSPPLRQPQGPSGPEGERRAPSPPPPPLQLLPNPQVAPSLLPHPPPTRAAPPQVPPPLRSAGCISPLLVVCARCCVARPKRQVAVYTGAAAFAAAPHS
jgi:hypothetical protein